MDGRLSCRNSIVAFAGEPTLTIVKIRDIGKKRRVLRGFMIGRNATTPQVPALGAFRASQTASVDTERDPPLQSFGGTPDVLSLTRR